MQAFKSPDLENVIPTPALFAHHVEELIILKRERRAESEIDRLLKKRGVNLCMELENT